MQNFLKKFIQYQIILATTLSLSAFAQEDDSSLSYDITVSTGRQGTQTYTEANLGVNYFLKEWINWRNSIFVRSLLDSDDVYGFDSSLRLYWRDDFSEKGLFTIFAAPGLRVPSEGDSALFAEAGINLNMGGFNIGLGVKTVFNELIDDSVPNDTQYFVTLSGSGKLNN